jgi:hypothetical protein
MDGDLMKLETGAASNRVSAYLSGSVHSPLLEVVALGPWSPTMEGLKQ